MVEIFSIIILILSLIIFFNFPFNYYHFNKTYLNFRLGYADSLLLNGVIIINLFLLLSFFKLNFNYYFFTIIFFSLYFIIKNFRKYIISFKKNIPITLVFLAIIYSMSSIIARTTFLEWDGLGHWFFKVQVYFQGGEFKDLQNVPINYYPHLGSYIWAFFWKNSISQFEYFGRIFFVFIFLISIFSLINKLSDKFSLIEKLLIVFCIGYLSTNFYLFGGYQEYLIFFSLFCFSYFFLHLNEINHLFKKSYIPEVLFVLILNIILWTKLEGLIYFIILSFIFLLHGNRNFNQKVFFLTFSFLFLSFYIFIFYYFKYSFFSPSNDYVFPLDNFNLSVLTKKIFIILEYLFITFFKYPVWLLIILSFFILRYKSNFFKLNKFFYSFLFLSLAFIFATFLSSKLDLRFLVPITLNRIVFALSGFYIILVISALNKIKK